MAASGQVACAACCPRESSALETWPRAGTRSALSTRQLEQRDDKRRAALEAHPELSALVLESKHADLVAWVRGRAWFEAGDLNLAASAASFPGAYEALGYDVPMEMSRVAERLGEEADLDVASFLRHHRERECGTGRLLVLDSSGAEDTLVHEVLRKTPSRKAVRTVRLVPTDLVVLLEKMASNWILRGGLEPSAATVEDTDSDEVLETAMLLSAEGAHPDAALPAARALA